MNLKQMEQGVLLLLKGMGLNPAEANYRGTPGRVARMYKELLTPKESRWSFFPAASSDLVLLRRHQVVGLCPHHLLPIEYSCSVGYIPAKRTVGLSKLARIVETQCVIPLLQEDLTHNVALALEEQLQPRGVGVITAGRHGCMTFRGVKTNGDVVVSVMRGIFHTDAAARTELLDLIGRP